PQGGRGALGPDSEAQAKVRREGKRIGTRPAGRPIELERKVRFDEEALEYALRLFEVPALIQQRDESKLRRVDIEGHAHPDPEAVRQAIHDPRINGEANALWAACERRNHFHV